MLELGNELLARSASIAPMGDAPDPEEVASQRGGRPCEHCEAFAEPRRELDHSKRQAPRARELPRTTGFVEEVLERDRLLVSHVVDALDAGPQDRRLDRAE